MDELETYLKEASKQMEDDLVFPVQDFHTLYMNILNIVKKTDTI